MTKDRKQALLQLLKEAPKALNGQSLAEHFHVKLIPTLMSINFSR